MAKGEVGVRKSSVWGVSSGNPMMIVFGFMAPMPERRTWGWKEDAVIIC